MMIPWSRKKRWVVGLVNTTDIVDTSLWGARPGCQQELLCSPCIFSFLPLQQISSNFPLTRCGQVTQLWTMDLGSIVVLRYGFQNTPLKERGAVGPFLFLPLEQDKLLEAWPTILTLQKVKCWRQHKADARGGKHFVNCALKPRLPIFICLSCMRQNKLLFCLSYWYFAFSVSCMWTTS